MGNCQSLKDAFQNGEDIHTHTARLIFHKQDVTRQRTAPSQGDQLRHHLRQDAVGIVGRFGHIAQASRRIHQELLRISSPKSKRSWTRKSAPPSRPATSTTKFQRRRYIPEVKDANYQVREFGKRMAMNAPIQGTAADLLKIAMVEIQRVFEAEGLRSELLASNPRRIGVRCRRRRTRPRRRVGQRHSRTRGAIRRFRSRSNPASASICTR
ncbi:MAG: DNA polymerase [Bacillus subtilis]|nr:DNA polymerase [Bacillus subtilis]